MKNDIKVKVRSNGKIRNAAFTRNANISSIGCPTLLFTAGGKDQLVYLFDEIISVDQKSYEKSTYRELFDEYLENRDSAIRSMKEFKESKNV